MNDKEAKSQEQRLGWAIFLSILFHIFLIFLSSHLKNDVPKEENRVMTVRLVQEHPVPEGMKTSPITIEDLFVFMAKEEKG